MSSEYHIALHSKTPKGFENYAVFYIGSNEKVARQLFSSLKGHGDNLGDALLIMELRHIYRNLPVDIKMIGCSLDQVTENTRTITKYLFNTFNPEPSTLK